MLSLKGVYPYEQLWESYLNDELSMFMLLHLNI